MFSEGSKHEILVESILQLLTSGFKVIGMNNDNFQQKCKFLIYCYKVPICDMTSKTNGLSY